MNAVQLAKGHLPFEHARVLALVFAHPEWELERLAAELGLDKAWLEAVVRADFFQAHVRAALRAG
jgi:hypothetical protein